MRKILLLLTLSLISASLFGGWRTNTRNKCKTFAKKYVAEARTFTGYPAIDRDASCSQAYAELIKYCAYQKVSNGPSGSWQLGGVNNNFCSRGETVSYFDQFFLPNASFNQNIEESDLKSDEVSFDEQNHSIIIPNISGYVKLSKNNGYYSNFRLSVWKPTDDIINEIADESMESSEVLHQFEVKVTDNGVYFNGNLVSDELKSKFKIHDDGRQTIVTFTDVTIEIPIDANVSLDELAVQMDGDGAPDTENNAAKMVSNTNDAVGKNEVLLKVYPNPAKNIVNIEFSNNFSNAATIDIFDIKGKKVHGVLNKKLTKEKGVSKLAIDSSLLTKGHYYILIESNGKKFTKQLIID
ncbi:T9SS type A sorting domain-containing protein [Chryseobacterium sp.]|uniref:T9SS type A sorting domain-containing protein n=1 Tax=Chryseobacterium sp. TaxID=1871047 RepID=UPI0012A96163|nr:T9SS type A sorting domain-containing protein [Chryseobacterium sp.]QFG54506.1 T9SS type A sorting domain-containing protein [Chryseobacterium sp.]